MAAMNSGSANTDFSNKMKAQFSMRRDRLAALLLAAVLFLGPENSRAEVPEKPQQLRESLARQLPENGLPAPADLLLDGGTLRISFAADSKLREAKDMLPVLLVAYSAMRESGVAAAKISVRAPLPEGETLSAEATTEVLASYLDKQITAQAFAEAVRSEVLPWEPSGQTRQEIIEAYFQKGREMVNQKHYDRALPLFKEVYEMDPENVHHVNKALALCLVQTGDPIAALPHLAKARKQTPDDQGNVTIAALLAKIVYDSGDFSMALELAEDFLTWADKGQPVARGDLMAIHSAALYGLERYALTATSARACVKAFPEDVRGWRILAKSLNKQEKYQELLPVAQKASEIDPEDADSFFLLGRAQQETGKYRQAVQTFERARKLLGTQNPSESLFTNLSFCYGKLNDMTMCVQVAGEGLKIYPGNEALQRNYKIGYKAQLKK